MIIGIVPKEAKKGEGGGWGGGRLRGWSHTTGNHLSVGRLTRVNCHFWYPDPKGPGLPGLIH